MPFLRHILILFIISLINDSKTFEINTESPIMTTKIQPIHERVAAEVFKIDNDLKNAEEQLKIDRHKLNEEKKIMQKYIKKTDVIRLNVGGDIIMTTRETLTRVPKSILSIMFNGRWELRMEIDKNDNIFLDFNPILFRHLLDQLQLFDRNSLNTISLPSDPSLVIPFKKMMRKLGLNELLSSEKNVITFNIGGQVVTNRRNTFTQISNSTFDSIVSSFNIKRFNNKNDVFVDNNPKLFQHMINQLREGLPKNKSYLNSLSHQENIFFRKMLIALKIFKQLIPSTRFNANTKWKQNGITIAGGNNNGSQLNQISGPYGIDIDKDDQSIYIADYDNHRIVQWKYGANNGQVVAGGNGQGNGMNQLGLPVDVVVDKENDSLIICDNEYKRVVRWPRQNVTNGQIIISNINCRGLAMDKNGDLYISNYENHEVKRWRIGETNGIIVAGGKGKGNHSNQLDTPAGIFVDENYSVYVSDRGNHRVMKWMKGAKEGIVVAGGQGQGSNLTQLCYPWGIIVDHSSNVYVADGYNHRIMRWSPGSKEGKIVVGGNGVGQQPNQFHVVTDLSFDDDGNLYVADHLNNRIQRFDIE